MPEGKLQKQLPKKNKRIGTPYGEGRVLDVLPLQDAVLVAVGDGLQVVKREEIVPLEELEALAKKSSEPCDKHDGGGCDCGANPGTPAEASAAVNAAQDELGADAGLDALVRLALKKAAK